MFGDQNVGGPNEGEMIVLTCRYDQSMASSSPVELAGTNIDPKLELKPWRLRVVLLSIFIGLFLSFLDTTIVSVALATIASNFQSFADSSWVFTSYLLTYMAFGTILARLSDIVGLGTVEAICMTIFLAFSACCGSARNMTQLVIFRSLQGIGGSGLYSMYMAISLAVVPSRKISNMATYVSATQAIATVLGPILGGIITQQGGASSWRWIFYLNLPLCSLALVGFLVAWPRHSGTISGCATKLKNLDLAGSLLLLIASVMLIFGLQEGGAHAFPWGSPVIVSSFWVCGVAVIAFLGWEKYLEQRKNRNVKPVFPVSVAGQRVVASAIIVTTLNGFLYYLIVLNLPNRFQLVNGDSPQTAGLRLLPLVASSAVGTFFVGALSKKYNITAYTAMVGSSFQLIGHGLMTTLSTSGNEQPLSRIYGFQILLGMGFGVSLASTTLLTVFRFLDQPQYTAVMQGCVAQARSLGGSIGLSISTIIFNSKIQNSSALARLVPESLLNQLYKSPLVVESMTIVQKDAIARVYAEAFKQQMWLAMCVALCAVISSFGCWEKNPPPTPQASKR